LININDHEINQEIPVSKLVARYI